MADFVDEGHSLGLQTVRFGRTDVVEANEEEEVNERGYLSPDLTPLAILSEVTTARSWDEGEVSLELRELIGNFSLQDGANPQDFDHVFLFVTDVLRFDENGLTGVIGANALDNEVDKGLVYQPVLLVVAEEHAVE